MDSIKSSESAMSFQELKNYFLDTGRKDLAEIVEQGITIEEILSKHGIKGTLNFRVCKQYTNSLISWLRPTHSDYKDLILVRLSSYTAQIIKKAKETGVPYDLLYDRFAEKGTTSKGIPYFELHIMSRNEFDPYDEPVDLDPDGSLQSDARSEMSGGFDNGDWGGLTDEEAELGYWNCD